MAGRLYVVATPIGNLEDITLRALRILSEADFVVAEDTRRIRKLLSHYKVGSKELVSYREQNRQRAAEEVVRRLREGLSCALVTDSGTPCVSDPGSHLVSAAAAEGVQVVPVPGPSALSAVLSVAGVASERFTFLGFLPRKHGRRIEMLRSARDAGFAVVLFESPHRLSQLLSDLEEVFGEKTVVVARELTKLHEEIKRGKPAQLREIFSRATRGEVTVLVERGKRDSREEAAAGASN